MAECHSSGRFIHQAQGLMQIVAFKGGIFQVASE
jgi:hypothetical protein